VLKLGHYTLGEYIMSILICDDDLEIAKAISIYLQHEGYQTILAGDGAEALKRLEENEVSLIIMDIMMPKMDGYTATLKIREERNIPIIMLSAKSESTDKISGLNFGADDYMTKPFNALELVARVKSQLRRYKQLGGAAEIVSDKIYRSGGLMLNDLTKEVFIDGEAVKATPIEYKILRFLLCNAGRVYSIDQIYEHCWNEPSFNAENTVAVHIRRIREKIEINVKDPKYIKVVWGIGYKIEKYNT